MYRFSLWASGFALSAAGFLSGQPAPMLLASALAIAVDLMESAVPQDQVILVTGDGDFLPLIEKLLARSVQVTVVGPQRQTSQRLKKLQQEGFTFLPLESLYADILEIQKLTAA